MLMDSCTCTGVFKECCTYILQMNGTSVDMLWDDCEEVGNVWSDCEEGGGTNCEDGDSDTEWYR